MLRELQRRERVTGRVLSSAPDRHFRDTRRCDLMARFGLQLDISAQCFRHFHTANAAASGSATNRVTASRIIPFRDTR
jgi:hypothetical protein